MARKHLSISTEHVVDQMLAQKESQNGAITECDDTVLCPNRIHLGQQNTYRGIPYPKSEKVA